MKWNVFPDFVWGDTGYFHPWAKNEEKALTNGDWKHLCLLHPTQIPNGRPTKKPLPSQKRKWSSNFRPSFFRGFPDKVPLVKPAVLKPGEQFSPNRVKGTEKMIKMVGKHGENGKTFPHFTNGLQDRKLTTAGCHTTPQLALIHSGRNWLHRLMAESRYWPRGWRRNDGCWQILLERSEVVGWRSYMDGHVTQYCVFF